MIKSCKSRELITIMELTRKVDDKYLPDDVLISTYCHRRTVYIQSGPEFGNRVYGVHIDFEDPNYIYCTNQYAFHPNINFSKPEYTGCSEISKQDLDYSGTDYDLIMSLRHLIQNPNTNDPYNLDASVMMSRSPEEFKTILEKWKHTDDDPFDMNEEVEYIIKKV